MATERKAPAVKKRPAVPEQIAEFLAEIREAQERTQRMRAERFEEKARAEEAARRKKPRA